MILIKKDDLKPDLAQIPYIEHECRLYAAYKRERRLYAAYKRERSLNKVLMITNVIWLITLLLVAMR